MNTFKEHVFEKEFWHNIKLIPHNRLVAAKKAIEEKQIFKLEIGQWKGLHIYLVDGNEVKIQHDTTFTESANSQAQQYVPKNEIWINAQMDVKSFPFNAYHEIIESFYMNTYDMGYEQAHDIADVAEKQMRIAHDNL